MYQKLQNAIGKLPNRTKNPFFWLGIIGTILAAGEVDFQTLTSWKLFGEAILGILGNPVALVSTILCIVGISCDTSTPGLLDKKLK